jgi:hypothetical protein
MDAYDLNDPHGIKRRRSALRWTERELARRAGVPYQRVQALERPSPAGKPSYSRYLADVMRALDEGEGNPAAPLMANPRFAALPVKTEMSVYAMRPNQTGGMDITGRVAGTTRVPRSMAHVEDAYAVQIWGSGMAPKYHPKDIVFVNPIAPPRPFGGVLVRSEDRSDVHIGEFVSETADEWIIAQFGIARSEKRCSRADYPIIHAIVAVSTDLVAI